MLAVYRAIPTSCLSGSGRGSARTVDQELLIRNDYLNAENRILRAQIKGRLRLTDSVRKTLAQIGKCLSRRALQEVAEIVTPDMILAGTASPLPESLTARRNAALPDVSAR
jgi:hypothetical protein